MNEAKVTHTDRALRGLRQLGLSQLLTQIVSWSLTAITVHILHPQDYGLLATAGMFTIFAQMLIDGGLTEVLVSQRSLSTRTQGAAFTAVLLVASLVGAIIFAIARPATTFFHKPALRAILEVSAFYLPLTALGFSPRVLLTKQMQFKNLGRIQLVTGVFQGLSSLALAYAGEAYWALIIGNFLGMGLRVILLWLTLIDKPTPNLHFRELLSVMHSGGRMIGQRFSYFGVDNLDIFLLSRFWGSADLGSYSVARGLAHTALDKISAVTRQVSVPTFAAKTETEDQLRGLLTVVSISATIAFPLFWIMGVVSQVALPMIFGLRWLKMVFPFAAFASILPFRTIYTLLNSSLIGTGRIDLTLKNTLTWILVLIPFLLAGVSNGADGVALGWAASFPIIFYIAMRRISKAFSIEVSALLKPLAIPAISAALSASLSEGVLLALAKLVSPALLLISQCVIAMLSFVIFLRVLNFSQYQQTLSFIRRVLRP